MFNVQYSMIIDRGSFASKVGIILATAGSAVGLGNIWRFPVETGSNGGAAFIIIYLACVLILGIPMMTAEFIIGRRTHTNIASAYQQLAPGEPWFLTGYAGMLCVTLILSYYSVVAGWTLKYAVSSALTEMSTVSDTAAYFADFASSTWSPLCYSIIFLLITNLIIERGVEHGIESFSKVLMPVLLLIMGVLVFGALSMPGAKTGVEYLLKPDFSKITADVVLSALGQAFFSLSLAIGCLSTYASYFKDDVNLGQTAASVVSLDTAVAILSGFIIFPAVFSVAGVQPDAGPGLVFITLPNIFNNVFGGLPVLGYIFSLLFYLLLVLAALTSTISMHEEVTAFIYDRYQVSRKRAASVMTIVSIILSVLCCLSFGPLKDFTPFFGMGFFDFFNYLTAKFIMPISGIFLCLFVGWRLKRELVVEEITNKGTLPVPAWVCSLFIFFLRWIAPVIIALIFVNELGWG